MTYGDKPYVGVRGDKKLIYFEVNTMTVRIMKFFKEKGALALIVPAPKGSPQLSDVYQAGDCLGDSLYILKLVVVVCGSIRV